MPTIGSEIRAARERRHMMQADLCLMSGVSMDRIAAMEKGNNPRLDDLLRICGVLGVTLGTVIRHPDRTEAWITMPPRF